MQAIKDAAANPGVTNLKGLNPRHPIDCDTESNCKRFINLIYDYTLRRVSKQYILGIAQPRLYKNANISFVSSPAYYYIKKQRLKGLIDVAKQCGIESGSRRPNIGDTDDRVKPEQLICELNEGLTNNQGQMQIANKWKYCSVKSRQSYDDQRCTDINQVDAIFSYISGKSISMFFSMVYFVYLDRNSDYECDETMLNSLLYDVWMTSMMASVRKKNFFF